MKIYFPSKDKEDFMYTLEDIQAVDMEVAQAITDELDRQNSHIELILSLIHI